MLISDPDLRQDDVQELNLSSGLCNQEPDISDIYGEERRTFDAINATDTMTASV